ncbi:receptor-like serine/threonine-protein kinase SD1-8 [Ricinus communis]|uniref:receptor-like serine/threonine-protein kinase SD1-8 n=1 Tax=Ricinus communis TaxID=3988 RepID=UPI00201A7580|nr:receptor-like serine/threonine-protein kinase SD1-8 [Ricinus communis]
MDSKRLFHVIAVLLLFNFFSLFDAIDTITQTQLISDGKSEALLSSNGNFKLGFFSPSNSIRRYPYVNNEDEISISFTARNGTLPSVLVLEPMGTLQRLVWWNNSDSNENWDRFWMAPQYVYDEYAKCGASAICTVSNAVQCTCLPRCQPLDPADWSLTCVEKRKESCGKGDGEGFITLERVKVPDCSFSRVYAHMGLKECEKEYLKNCNCTDIKGIILFKFRNEELNVLAV